MTKGLFAFAMVMLVAGTAAAQPSAPLDDEARDRSEAAYETAFIVFEDEYAAYIRMEHWGDYTHGTVTPVRNAVPIRGVQRERLSPVEFYDAVGRDDLASDYQSGRRKQLVVGGVSLGAFGLSATFGTIAMVKWMSGPDFTECDIFSPTWEACNADVDRRARINDAQARNWAIGAGVALVGGVVLGAIFRSIDPHPVSESERRMLAHDHNERLRRELRLPRRRPATPTVSVTPFVDGDAAGLSAVGRF
ncbi:MAG TPA: hypothetical protein VM261_28760 [Kofleriaceae bacterium]|nr:hypothetical protein [Kofleriaceae bacterium]